jgi:hypothetical protein
LISAILEEDDDDVMQITGISPQKRNTIKMAFSKLPCIKTCLTKFEVTHEGAIVKDDFAT